MSGMPAGDQPRTRPGEGGLTPRPLATLDAEWKGRVVRRLRFIDSMSNLYQYYGVSNFDPTVRGDLSPRWIGELSGSDQSL